MTTNNNIQEAIKMIENHDWNWRMSDYGYEQNYKSAKAHMKAFVRFVKTIDDAAVRETLRNMWKMVFNDKREEYNICKSELLKVHAA